MEIVCKWSEANVILTSANTEFVFFSFFFNITVSFQFPNWKKKHLRKQNKKQTKKNPNTQNKTKQNKTTVESKLS